MIHQDLFDPLLQRSTPLGRLIRKRQAPYHLRSDVVKRGNQIPTSLDQVVRLCFLISIVNQQLKAVSADVGDSLAGVVVPPWILLGPGGHAPPGTESGSDRLHTPLGLGLLADDLADDNTLFLLEWPGEIHPGLERYAFRLAPVTLLQGSPPYHERVGTRVVLVLVVRRPVGRYVPGWKVHAGSRARSGLRSNTCVTTGDPLALPPVKPDRSIAHAPHAPDHGGTSTNRAKPTRGGSCPSRA